MGLLGNCCCDCYVYLEDFVRPNDDVELLEPDWESCDSWGNWEIQRDVNNLPYLTNINANATITLKHMVGNPCTVSYQKSCGHLKVVSKYTPGDVQQIIVFKGTEENACGAEDYLVELESTGNQSGKISIKKGGTELRSAIWCLPFDSDNIITWHVCVDDEFLEAWVDGEMHQDREGGGVCDCETTDTECLGLARLRECVNPDNYWFAIRGVTADTIFRQVRYEDHFLHNEVCPKCTVPCCFDGIDDFNQLGLDILGFIVTIKNIQSSECDCQSEWSFYLEVENPDDLCKCFHKYVLKPGGTTIGPHGCFLGISYVDATYSCEEERASVCVCDTPEHSCFTMTVIPSDGYQGETQFQKCFPKNTHPSDIKAEEPCEALVFSLGDEQGCKYENALLCFTPVLANCCGDEPE